MNILVEKLIKIPNCIIIVGIFLTLYFSYSNYNYLVVSFLMVFLLVWYLSIAFSLYKILPQGVNLSLRWFLATFLYAFVYAHLVKFIFHPGIDSKIILMVVPVHLFAVYSVFYGMYFVSKCLVSIEDKKNVSFDRCVGTIFQLWFFPIGMWFILPRIKKQLKK